METFDEWFSTLSEKEQKEYVEDLTADYYIELHKENPEYY